jgi:hypothetical protein
MKKVIVFLTIMSVYPVFSVEIPKVKNGITPAGKAMTLVFTEDLVIAPDDDRDETIWPSIQTSVAVNSQGHMFVTDPESQRVIEFDEKGVFVRVIGHKGQGPGEFQALQSFQILDDGTALAFEQLQVASTVNVFDTKMVYQDKSSFQDIGKIITSAQFSPDGTHLFSVIAAVNIADKKIVNKYAILDRKMNILKELLSFETAMPDQSRMMESAYWSEFLAQSMKKSSKGLVGMVAFASDGSIYTAKASKYEITKWDSNLKPQWVIEKKYKPIPFTDKDLEDIIEPIQEGIKARLPPQMQSVITPQTIKKAVELADFPAVKNPLAGLRIMPDGTLIAIHDVKMGKGEGMAHLFDSKGHFLGSFMHDTLGLLRMVFKDGYGYTIEIRDDENALVRYKVELKPVS